MRHILCTVSNACGNRERGAARSLELKVEREQPQNTPSQFEGGAPAHFKFFHDRGPLDLAACSFYEISPPLAAFWEAFYYSPALRKPVVLDFVLCRSGGGYGRRYCIPVLVQLGRRSRCRGRVAARGVSFEDLSAPLNVLVPRLVGVYCDDALMDDNPGDLRYVSAGG